MTDPERRASRRLQVERGTQFGGGTAIPRRIGLIVMDCFETLVELDGQTYRPRNGVVEFLDHFALQRGVAVAVLSDGAQTQVEQVLLAAGLSGRLARIWGAPESLAVTAAGRQLKRLDLPLASFGVAAEECIFIGDSPLDAEAAKHHQIPFIRVPRSEDRDFSFQRLIEGPSRYHSAEFSALFLERYLGKKQP